MIYDTECTKKACEEETIRNNHKGSSHTIQFKGQHVKELIMINSEDINIEMLLSTVPYPPDQSVQGRSSTLLLPLVLSIKHRLTAPSDYFPLIGFPA